MLCPMSAPTRTPDALDDGPQDLQRIAERIAADPRLAARLADAVAAQLPAAKPPGLWQRSQPFVAALSSAAVVLLAFLLPSIQEQWDRYRSGAAVERYAQIGRQLSEEGHHASAEQAFAKAFELAGSQRLDLMQAQMEARVMRVNEDPEWLGEIPSDVNESDFIYLLELETGPTGLKQRAATLGAYGVYLASKGRWQQAEQRLREAIKLAPDSADAHVNLANLLDDLDRRADAESEFRKALELDADEPAGRYNYGVFLAEAGRHTEAEPQLRAYVRLQPADPEGYERLAETMRALGRAEEASELTRRARRLDPAAARLRRAAEAQPSSAAPSP